MRAVVRPDTQCVYASRRWFRQVFPHESVSSQPTLRPPATANWLDLTSPRDLQVAHQALRGVPARQSPGAEARAVGTDSPSDRRVAGQAVALGVAGGATLQALPGRAPVLEQPERLRIVKRHVEPALRSEP